MTPVVPPTATAAPPSALAASLAAALRRGSPVRRRGRADRAFPSKPVRILTPFPAGSGPDVALRVVAERLARKWAQPVIVDNRPGGNGFIAIGALQPGRARRPRPDPARQQPPHDASAHLQPAALRPAEGPGAGAPAVSQQLLRRRGEGQPVQEPRRHRRRGAGASPASVSYGSWFNGSPGHLGALRLQKMQGHRDAARALQGDDAALRRRRDAGGGVGARQRGQRRAAREGRQAEVHRGRRARALQGVSERAVGRRVAGAPGATRCRPGPACSRPKGTPKALREKISADVLEALESPEVAERYRGFDYEPFDAGPDAFASSSRRETQNWADVIQAANLKLD